MKNPAYTHPTFNHFLHFHLGPFLFANDQVADKLTVSDIMRLLDKKGFPFKHTQLREDVFRRDDPSDQENGLTLMCAKGEPIHTALQFLTSKMLTDRDINKDRDYGPIIIEATDKHDSFVAYYDHVVRDIFTSSVAQSLYTDPTTMKTSWYGQVNAHNQEKYLEKIVTQLVNLRGISTLFATHLNTRRGASILTDSARASSLAISLIRQINPYASDHVIYTLGFACFVQHFGALFNGEEEYYPGKIYKGPCKPTLEMLTNLGITPRNKNSLPDIEVNIQDVLHILRYTGHASEEKESRNMALVHCFSIVNYIVATYFTENRRVYKDKTFSLEPNPSFRSVSHTMDSLDATFKDVYFFQHHRDKIEAFITNADRYYAMHIRSKMNTGGFVSASERAAIQAKYAR
ncbi:MAG: hypothetical protein ACE5G0_07330 [Rhodothermales bacterium]